MGLILLHPNILRRRFSISPQPQTIPDVPKVTARIARTAFPKDNLYMQLRDELGVLFQNKVFPTCF
jgi:hypothetical protein